VQYFNLAMVSTQILCQELLLTAPTEGLNFYSRHTCRPAASCLRRKVPITQN